MKLCNFNIGLDQPFFLIAGPCVVESESLALEVAWQLKEICGHFDIPFIYKSSFDKANRSSVESYRGPGMLVDTKLQHFHKWVTHTQMNRSLDLLPY